MSDLIKRQDAIDAFRKSTADGDKVDFCVSVINEVPSAERKGQWILHQDSRTWECSECYKYQVIWSNYCMHCGADMRGEEDDS